MKNRTIIIALIAIPLVASCFSFLTAEGGNDEVIFRPVVGIEIRSDENKSDPTGQMSFGVWAGTSTGALYIDRVHVTWDGDEWTTSQTITWPEEGGLKFIAYAPYEAAVNIDKEARITVHDYDLSDGKSALYLTDLTPVTLTSENNVPLDFRPATSRLDFEVANGLNQDTSIKIEKITLCGLYVHGDFDSKNSPQWTPNGERTNVVVFDCETSSEDNAADRLPEKFGGFLEVIPQQIQPYIEVVYSFSNSDSGWLTGQVSRTENLDANWVAGKQYTYTLTITETVVKCTAGISQR